MDGLAVLIGASGNGEKMERMITSLSALLILLCSITLSACGSNDTQQRILDAANSNTNAQADVATVSFVQQAVKDLLTKYQDTEESDEESKLLSCSVSLSSEGLAAVDAAATTVQATYPYCDLSNVEAAYRRYQSLPDYQGDVAKNKLLTNLPLDANTLFEIVKENNAAHLIENPVTSAVRDRL